MLKWEPRDLYPGDYITGTVSKVKPYEDATVVVFSLVKTNKTGYEDAADAQRLVEFRSRTSLLRKHLANLNPDDTIRLIFTGQRKLENGAKYPAFTLDLLWKHPKGFKWNGKPVAWKRVFPLVGEKWNAVEKPKVEGIVDGYLTVRSKHKGHVHYLLLRVTGKLLSIPLESKSLQGFKPEPGAYVKISYQGYQIQGKKRFKQFTTEIEEAEYSPL